MNFLPQIGLTTILFGLVYFAAFTIGLARIFHQAGIPTWKAFIPVFNFMFLVDLTGLPRKFFWYSLIPYVGTIYAFGVMNPLSSLWSDDYLYFGLAYFCGGFRNTCTHL